MKLGTVGWADTTSRFPRYPMNIPVDTQKVQWTVRFKLKISFDRVSGFGCDSSVVCLHIDTRTHWFLVLGPNTLITHKLPDVLRRRIRRVRRGRYQSWWPACDKRKSKVSIQIPSERYSYSSWKIRFRNCRLKQK